MTTSNSEGVVLPFVRPETAPASRDRLDVDAFLAARTVGGRLVRTGEAADVVLAVGQLQQAVAQLAQRARREGCRDARTLEALVDLIQVEAQRIRGIIDRHDGERIQERRESTGHAESSDEPPPCAG